MDRQFRQGTSAIATVTNANREEIAMDMMRRDFLLSGTVAAAATMTVNGPVLAQNSPAPEAGTQQPAPSTAPYKGSELNQKIKIINLIEIEAEAQKVLPAGGFGYISSGSGANWTRRENMAAFERV